MIGKLGLLGRTYAYVSRYRQILFVLLKYGFDDLLHNLHIDHYLELGWHAVRSKRAEQVAELSRAARFRLVLEELGPTFVKMGQTLSTRSDLLPEDMLLELSKLQDSVAPFPAHEAHAILLEELGDLFQKSFIEFDDEPLAAGSIGQVHRGRLVNGAEVAIKVQRPGIRRKIDVDLEIMHQFASLMERNLELGQIHKPTAIVLEFARTLLRELDYLIEASNIERFATCFKDHPEVHIPAVYRDLSSARVLVIEFVHGTKPTDLDALRLRGHDPKHIARLGARITMEQVFVHGYFHADPHPGNLLIGNDGRLILLDFGMMGRLDRITREIFADLLYQIVSRNEVKTTEVLLRITHGHKLIDRQDLEREVAELIDQHLYRPLKKLEVGVLIRQVLELSVKHELRLPPQHFLLIKALSQIEDLGRQLDPDFDLASVAGPYVAKLLRARYHPNRVAADLYETGTDLVYLFKEVPGELRELLKQAKQGKARLELEHLGLKPLLNTLERVSNRISSAIVLASLVIGSSLIVLSKVPPLWNNIPIIGLAGYLISAVMGMFLLRSIAKDRNR